MPWFNTQGACPEFVLYSKVRYIRNIAKQNFYPVADSKKNAESIARIESVLSKNGFRQEKLAHSVTPALLALAEKQFIERELVYTEHTRALYLNEPCSLIVSLGGYDLLTVSSIVAGLSVSEAKNIASGAEELIDREVEFAYSESLGYLSPSPRSTGSGLCFSACLYLPSLRLAGSCSLSLCLLSLGMSLSPMFTHKDNAGDLYILSYTPHHLCCEDSAASFFSNTVTWLADRERASLLALYSEQVTALDEQAARALGALLYSRSLGEAELLSYLSLIRLALILSQDKSSCLPKLSTLNYLVAEGLSASVSASRKCSSMTECDISRASLVKDYISHKADEPRKA